MKDTAAPHFAFVEVEGLRLRAHVQPGSGLPLVILNGLGQRIEVLDPLVAEFAGRAVVRIDAAGIGRSAVPPQELSIPDHARMFLGVLDALGIDRFDLLGISWGGAAAQQIALDAPGRCRRLVLSITSPGGAASWWGWPVSVSEIALPLRYSSRAYAEAVGPWMYGGEALLFPQMFRDYLKDSTPPSMAGYYGQVRATCSWTSLGWLPTLTQPTMVMGGIYDTLIPVPNQLTLAALIPGARLRLYPAGHLLMYSWRGTVAREIAGFLDG